MTANALTAPVPPSERRGNGASLRPATGAGVVLVVLLGALPAALVGLEPAWLIVVAGLASLAMAPLLARRQAVSVDVAERAENTATPRRADHAVRSRTRGPWRRARPPARRRRGRLGSVQRAGPSPRGSPAADRNRHARDDPRQARGARTPRRRDPARHLLVPVLAGARRARGPRSTASHGAAAPARPGGARARRALRSTTLVGESADRAARMRTSGLPVRATARAIGRPRPRHRRPRERSQGPLDRLRPQ